MTRSEGTRSGYAHIALSSALSRFFTNTIGERRREVASRAGLTGDDLRVLSGDAGLSETQVDRMIENALGVFEIPLGVCTNLRVNGRDRLVPMAIEESSVIAASSYAAKLLRAGGGVVAEVTAPHMIGQVQLLDVPDVAAAKREIIGHRLEILARANEGHPRLTRAGGGAFDLEVRSLPRHRVDDPVGDMLVVHLLVDVADAMGANAVNTMCEHVAPLVASLSGGRSGLRILSNLADQRRVVATGVVPLDALCRTERDVPERLARGIEEASVFAERDPYRAATNNKGVMNGIDAALIAFGQDWRAVEAGAHAFAARGGHYGSLTRWRVCGDELQGRIELPMAVGTVGGVTTTHPGAVVARRLAGIDDAADLAALVAAVGLAQNLGALRALSAEGIQCGHMRLHARKRALERPACVPRGRRHPSGTISRAVGDDKQSRRGR